MAHDKAGAEAQPSRESEEGDRSRPAAGYLLWLVVSLLLVVGPFLTAALGAGALMSPAAQLVSLSVGVVSLMLLSILVVITKLYRKASANRALVRTGMGGIRVILDGGSFFVPVLHKMLSVNLETMRLDVERKGKDALITADFLRADLSAQFYLKVQPSLEDITNAARSLGERSIDEVAVKELVFDKLVSALRTVAAKSTLFDLNSEREKFARDVKASVESDLRHNGLTLESVTISSLDQTDLAQLNDKNVFDAQGRKRIAEVTQAANVDRNRLEREAEQQIATKDVATRKTILTLELDRQRAEAEQERDVANARAAVYRQAAEFKIEQEQAVQQREVEQRRAVETAKLEAEKRLVQTQQERDIAEVSKEQVVATANVDKHKAVEVATRDQQIVIARKEQERAKAEAERLAAEAEREAQAQAVLTVEIVKAAEREKQKSVIAASAEAERQYVAREREADAEAYKLKALAEGKKAAAEAEAFAKIRAAEADLQASQRSAEGGKALGLVPVSVAESQVEVDRRRAMIDVQVAKERVEVDRKAVEVKKAQVDVEQQDLRQREEFSRAALDFEVAKLRLVKTAEVQVEAARAIGGLMAKGAMTIFGDPTTLATMTEKFMGAMGVGRQLDGLFAGLGDGAARDAVAGVVDAVTGLAKGGAALVSAKADAAKEGAASPAREETPEAEPGVSP